MSSRRQRNPLTGSGHELEDFKAQWNGRPIAEPRTHRGSGRGNSGSGKVKIRSGGFNPVNSLSQRVTVKGRVVKVNNANFKSNFRRFVKYLTRESAAIPGEKISVISSLPSAEMGLTVDRLAGLFSHWSEDRHYFRFIISPEQGAALNLNSYAREVMLKFETELGTKLQWFGVAHHNTDNPHVHLAIRGKDELGNDLVISREVMSHGLRRLCQSVATQHLGFVRAPEREMSLFKKVEFEGFGALDFRLATLSQRFPAGFPVLGRRFSKQHDLATLALIRRLDWLQRRGLATRIAPNRWKLSPSFQEDLQKLSKQRRVVELLREYLPLERTFEIHEPGQRDVVTGTVACRGLVDDLSDRVFIFIRDFASGKLKYVELANGSEDPNFIAVKGSTVTLGSAVAEKATYNLTTWAEARGGMLSASDILKETAQREGSLKNIELSEYQQFHLLRLKSLERAGVFRSVGDGKWLLQNIENAGPSIVRVNLEAMESLSSQVTNESETFLDSPKALRLLPDLAAQRREYLGKIGCDHPPLLPPAVRSFPPLQASNAMRGELTIKKIVRSGARAFALLNGPDGDAYCEIDRAAPILQIGLKVRAIKTRDRVIIRPVSRNKGITPSGRRKPIGGAGA